MEGPGRVLAYLWLNNGIRGLNALEVCLLKDKLIRGKGIKESGGVDNGCSFDEGDVDDGESWVDDDRIQKWRPRWKGCCMKISAMYGNTQTRSNRPGKNEIKQAHAPDG